MASQNDHRLSVSFTPLRVFHEPARLCQPRASSASRGYIFHCSLAPLPEVWAERPEPLLLTGSQQDSLAWVREEWAPEAFRGWCPSYLDKLDKWQCLLMADLFLPFLFAVAIVIWEVVYIQQKTSSKKEARRVYSLRAPSIRVTRVWPTAHRAVPTHRALCTPG